MLILYEVEYLCSLCFSYKLKRSYLQGCGQLAKHLCGLVIAESLLQKILGISDTTLSDILLS